MPINTVTKDAPEQKAIVNSAGKALEKKPENTDVTLALAFYSRYARGGELYESTKAYTFTLKQAAILLEEEDGGRPIWKKYHPVVRRVSPMFASPQVMNAKAANIQPVPSVDYAVTPDGAMEIGTEAELAELGLEIEETRLDDDDDHLRGAGKDHTVEI